MTHRNSTKQTNTYHNFIAIGQVEYACIEESDTLQRRVGSAISYAVSGDRALGTQVMVEPHTAEGREQAG